MNFAILFEFLKKNGLSPVSGILVFLWFFQAKEINSLQEIVFDCYEDRIKAAEAFSRFTSNNTHKEIIFPSPLVCVIPKNDFKISEEDEKEKLDC